MQCCTMLSQDGVHIYAMLLHVEPRWCTYVCNVAPCWAKMLLICMQGWMIHAEPRCFVNKCDGALCRAKMLCIWMRISNNQLFCGASFDIKFVLNTFYFLIKKIDSFFPLLYNYTIWRENDYKPSQSIRLLGCIILELAIGLHHIRFTTSTRNHLSGCYSLAWQWGT